MIDIALPEQNASLAGYAAIIERYNLEVPLPHKLSIISSKHKKYITENWQVFSPRYSPEDTLKGHLTFALKYEGIDLAVLSSLFKKADKANIEYIIKSEPLGSYARRIWFLFEWLKNEALDGGKGTNV